MACVESWEVFCFVLFVTVGVINIECVHTDRFGFMSPSPEFGKYSIFKPLLYHGREKGQIHSTREDKGSLVHLHHITVVIDLNGKRHILDLRLNRDLIPKNYFEKHQQNGSHIITRRNENETELCHYHGKVRGIENSWVAVSTCRGLRGVFYDGESLHYLERVNTTDEDDTAFTKQHYHYSHQDLTANFSCGYSGTEHNHITDFQSSKSRHKRSPEVIRGPYNANKQSRYVELVLVVDNKEYKALGENSNRVNSHCKDIANIINALYVPLNIFIALVGVVVWTEIDEIALSSNGDTTLTNFLHYRRERLVKDHPNDNAQLLTRVTFDGGVVGKALKGPICTFEFSGGVSMDHSAVVGLVATTVAHEMGHNFGMEHDVHACQCPDDRCIMAPSSSSMSPTHWSSCSLDYLSLAFEHGMDYCLRNKPERLFDSPVCGNGYVEAGEQCDCGLKENCDNPCCNATTCMLYSNASCATGECCDLKTCRPKAAGSICRSADRECDLPEFCTGQSEFCPDDVYKMDGETCNRGRAFCYQGSCRTHSDQCKLLWGPSGKTSDDQCYTLNKKGNRHGNCGYIRLNQTYTKCDDGNIYCGMLHCMHLNEILEFGMESVAILSYSFINSGGSIIPCRTAIVDLGLNQVDPGLVPNGAKCGEEKMCVNQKCITIQEMQAMASVGSCPQQCNNNGICNSKGHCHCRSGFAPPFCDYPGTGGSEDSGPASDPNARREVITALYIIFLGIVPFFSLVALFTYYMRRNPVLFRKKPHFTTVEKKTTNPRSSRDKGPGAGPVPSDNSQTSLLSQPETSKVSSADPSYLQSNLFGHYKGFSITPLQKQTLSSSTSSSSSSKLVPSRPAPPVKTVTNSQPVSPPKVPAVTVPYPTRSAPKVPLSNIGLSVNNIGQPNLMNPTPSRPDISSPVLDMTTSCTAKELIDKSALPVRPAPAVPAVPVRDKPRPLSTPNINDVVNTGGSKAKSKDSVYPTLTRLASFMIRSQKSVDDKDHSAKPNKIDRDVLRSLEISNPIPQKEISVPSNSVPAGEKVVVMRAQSLRDSSSGEKRQPIPSFGSMRVTNAKRPTSIPVGNRPSSPPPPRPPSINGNNFQSSGKLENTYDDCLNLLPEGVAPLANIDEESPTNPMDNIYATIEESPTDRRERKEIILPTKSEYTSPTGEYKSPKSIETSESASSDSMGLLGEIVSEIEARNKDSIYMYSASTLKDKKEKSDEAVDISLDIDSNNKTYINTPWCSMSTTPSASSSSSSSGYLSPINPAEGNKRELRKTETARIPETSAPSNKPYLQRNAEPLSAATLSKTEIPQKLPLSNKPFLNSKPKLLNNKTSVKSTTESNISNSSNDNNQGNESSLRSTLNNNFSRSGSSGLSLTKPDLVSSCATTSGIKSPDVLEGKVENKSNPLKPNLSSLRKGRNSTPTTNVTSSITTQPLPAIPSKVNTNDIKISTLKQNQSEQKSIPTKPVVNKQSNVASLQQKFEQGKGVIKSTKNTHGITKPSATKNVKPFNIKR